MKGRAHRRGTLRGTIDDLGRSPTVEVVMGGVAVTVLLTVLSVVLYLGWIVGGQGGSGFILTLAIAFVLIVYYSSTASRSIAGSLAWFTEPDGIIFLTILFVLVVIVTVLLV